MKLRDNVRRYTLVGGIGASSAVIGVGLYLWFAMPANPPAQLEYLPRPSGKAIGIEVREKRSGLPLAEAGASSALNPAGVRVDFSNETVGAESSSFAGIVGFWLVGTDGEKKVLVVDGRRWARGQPSAGLADKARALYGERYAEFLDNVKAYAYYPYAVLKGLGDFREGEISVRFEPIGGRVDQAAGILFNLKPNGDYLVVRANALEDNLVLWKFEQGKRSSVKWIRNTPTAPRQWHTLTVRINGKKVEGILDGNPYLQHTLTGPVSGQIGVWSKADSVVYFDRVTVKRNTQEQ